MSIPSNSTVGDTPYLEIALLRRSLPLMADEVERCGHCGRGLLIGERVYEYGADEIRCELCREHRPGDHASSHRVHGPAFGHSIRLVDRRAVGQAA